MYENSLCLLLVCVSVREVGEMNIAWSLLLFDLPGVFYGSIFVCVVFWEGGEVLFSRLLSLHPRPLLSLSPAISNRHGGLVVKASAS